MDDAKHVQISLGKTGVIFRIGKADQSIMLHENIICDYDEAADLLSTALIAIRIHQNG